MKCGGVGCHEVLTFISFVLMWLQTIDWDALDDLPPEWDTGIDDLLSLSTTYWEPGLGPRDTRKARIKKKM